MTNILIDVVNYNVDNIDPGVGAETEAVYVDRLKPRACDPVTQTKVIQDLCIATSKVERKVINTKSIISH